MRPNQSRRSKRNPLTPEEVGEIIALKQRRAHTRLKHFKRSRLYKVLNVFSVISSFLYFELLICFFGPCLYQPHSASKVRPNYGSEFNSAGEQVVSTLETFDETGHRYVFIVNDFIEVPSAPADFFVGVDFLLRRELKGFFNDEQTVYRLLRSSPVIFLSLIALAASMLGFLYDLNQHPYSLTAISVLNALTLLGIVCI